MSTDNKSLPDELNSAIKIIGDGHILCIISILSKGEQRFNELQRSINNINPTTLADRLKRLEQEKIISRKEETLDKLSVVYSLTKKGKALLPVIKEISIFADKYFCES